MFFTITFLNECIFYKNKNERRDNFLSMSVVPYQKKKKINYIHVYPLSGL